VPLSFEGDSSSEPRKAELDREQVFAGIVERHSRLMYRVAFTLLRNPQDAEDAVQEAFLKLYRGEAWRQMTDEKAYLARTVWRVALDRLPRRTPGGDEPDQPRQIADRPIEPHEEFASREASPETNAVRAAQSERLRRMIDALPEDLRQVLILSAIEELTSREIAGLLEMPEGTVRTRLMRAREELKRRFTEMKEARR
jgi:RNA polymerase sigma-70 factor (ECF subfamily)